MIVRAPPLQMGQEVWGLLRSGPGPSCERCHPMTDGQIHPRNESGVESSGKTQSRPRAIEIRLCPEPHHRRDVHQPAPLVMFLHLPVDQIHCYLPSKGFASTTPHSSPVSKMGGERIEVHIEAITRENWEAARRQDLSQGVNDTMRRALRARTKLKDRKNLGERINGQPEPQDLLGVAQPGAEFVQLEVRKLEGAEAVLVQGLCMLPCTSEKGS